MNLLESLVDAIVRLEGDALVMHVGEKPYVVTTSAAMSVHRGPIAWGQVELSSRVLTSATVLGMIAEILPSDLQQSLDAFGAVEHEISLADDDHRFTVVAARGGDDVWLELKRQGLKPAAAPATTPIVEPAEVTPLSADAEQTHEASNPTAAGTGAPKDQSLVVVGNDGELIATEQSPSEIESSEMMADETPVGVFKFEMPQSIDLQQAINEIADSAPAAESTVPGTALPAGPPAGRVSDESSLENGDETSRAVNEPHIQINLLPQQIETVQDMPDSEYTPIADSAGVQDENPLLAAAASALLTTISNGVSPDSEALAPEPSDMGGIQVLEPAARPLAAAASPPGSMPAGVEAAEASSMPAIEPTVEAPAPANSVSVSVVEPPTTASEAVRMSDQREKAPSATAVPIARVRPETTPGESAPAMGADALLRILRLAANRGASVVYIVAQSRPMLRVDGEISPLDDEAVLTSADVTSFAKSLGATDNQDDPDNAEWLSDVPEVGRVRHQLFHDHRGPGIIFRMIPARVLSAEQLGLSAEIQALCAQPDGLVIVTGAAMSGRSTLLSAFVDLISRSRSDHVVVIEPQIRFIHEGHRSFVSQREVRGGSEAVAQAARRALREDADVLVIEEISSPDVAAVALEGAAGGRLVLGSVQAPSATAAIEQLIDCFPAEGRAQMRTALAGSLRGVVAQLLLRKLKGGRVAAREVLLNSQAISSLILEGKTVQLPSVLSGRRNGMMPLTDSLAGLVRDGIVHVGEAYRKAGDREALLAALKREGIDTSFAETLG